MAGYRDTSNFDPYAGGDYGPPLRPYNWVQWTGVAFALVGVAIDLVYLGGSQGMIPKLLDSPSVGISLPLIGAALINSRRQPGEPLTAERKRRGLVVVAVAFLFMAIAAATIFYFKGA